MLTYRHTQLGWLMLTVLGGGALIALVTALVLAFTGGVASIPGIMAAFLAVACVLFYALHVTVSADRVTVRFGVGLIGKSFPTETIREATIVRNHWYYGWGIRLTPHGWLYNVSGFDAVEITLVSGRRYRIGTDDPEQLCATIRSAVQG